MSRSKKARNIKIRVGLLIFITVLFIGAFPGAVFAEAARKGSAVNTWLALQETINNAAAGETIKLTEDVTAGGSDVALNVPDGAVVTIDLNGHTIDRALKTSEGKKGSVICVQSGAVLTITDSSENAEGTITGGYAAHGGGIRNLGTLILEGGRVTGNISIDEGGGITNYGVLIVSGAEVTGNTAYKRAGGIYNTDNGYMTVANNAVYGNSAPRDADVRNTGSMKTAGGATVSFAAGKSYMDMVSLLPVLVLLAVLFFSVRLDNYLEKSQKKAMYIITILAFTLVIQNYLDTWLYQSGKWILLRTIFSIYGYAARPAILAMFLHIIEPDKKYRLVRVAVGANAALYLTALFSPLTFSYPNGYFVAGPLNQTCLILSAFLFIYCIYMTIQKFRPKERKETWIPFFALVLIGLSVALDYTVEYENQPVSFLTISVAICSLMYYIWLHLQFVREHEKALQAEHRIRIMMTQIQPHFLFNTLTAIRALCLKDQNVAAHVIGLFSTYLRQNLESLNQAAAIPLSKELEHTRIYTEIETVRFPNIRVEYDIRDEEYGVPALTVQPLVENAIRHGARSRKEGIVKVSAYREDGAHLIVIEDNGTGFDERAAEEADGTHIGIGNVRERLERICGGNMIINSRPGEGTKIVLRIPADEEMNK